MIGKEEGGEKEGRGRENGGKREGRAGGGRGGREGRERREGGEREKLVVFIDYIRNLIHLPIVDHKIK